MTDPAQLSRLAWSADDVPEPARTVLLGPGAPFELVTEDFGGIRHTVFAKRPRNLRAAFEATIARQPDAVFLVDGDRSWRYPEAIEIIESYSHVLVETYGIGRGDRVAIVAANSVEYCFAIWGIVSIGAIVSSLNGWWTGPEITHGIALSQPKLVLGDDKRLARLEPGSVPDGVPVRTLEAIAAEAAAAGPGGRSWKAEVDENDPAVILFTSGTTGRAKGATIAHRNSIHFAMANMLSGAIGMMLAPPPPAGAAPAPPRSQSASILASPLFHVSGLTAIFMTGPILGSKLVLQPPGRWDPTAFLEMTHEQRISTWSGVPTQFWRVLRHPDVGAYDLTCVTSAGGGGAVFSPELIRAMHDLLPNAVLGNGYGMSETVGMGTRNGGQMLIDDPESVGIPNPTVEIEIRDPEGNLVPLGEVGEIHLRMAAVFVGYWDNEAATTSVIDDQGWYRTGDFGRIRNGRLYLESRMRDLILRGGENIYPIEVENRLVEHPGIDDAAVIGVDHAELGQEVKAFVVLAEGASLTADDVKAWAAAHLAAFKVPAYVEFVATLPYTQTGKVQKHLLEQHERERSSTVPPAGPA